nr:hypothetical protein [Streptomyces sp. YIM 130001]
MNGPCFSYGSAPRLLPWAGFGGKPAYLVTDSRVPGALSRLADTVESVQLGMGADLVGHAEALLDDPEAARGELRFLSARLTESLREVLRVAESRGARLAAAAYGGTTSCDAREPDDERRPGA